VVHSRVLNSVSPAICYYSLASISAVVHGSTSVKRGQLFGGPKPAYANEEQRHFGSPNKKMQPEVEKKNST
jgi:hypothetical protein